MTSLAAYPLLKFDLEGGVAFHSRAPIVSVMTPPTAMGGAPYMMLLPAETIMAHAIHLAALESVSRA